MKQGSKECYMAYVSRMTATWAPIDPPLNEKDKIAYIRRGLKPALKRHMYDKKFTSLKEMAETALVLEINFIEDAGNWNQQTEKDDSIAGNVRQ